MFFQDLQFDLGDPVRWEFMLLGTDKPLLSLPEMEEEEDLAEDEVDDMVSHPTFFLACPSVPEDSVLCTSSS